MGWRDNRRRSICRKIMFTPEEWEQARRIHERWARNIPVYRRWGDFARQTLMHGALMNVSVTLASDPEVFKAELHHIGVNVNQIARIANLTGSVSPQQMRELHDLLALIDERMTGMEREKAEIDAVQGCTDGRGQTWEQGQDESSGHDSLRHQSREERWRQARIRELQQ